MSEYLSEEEQVARMKSWWDKYGTGVLVGLVIAVAGVVGWLWYDGYSAAQNEAASAQYLLYQDADEAEKISLAEQLATEFPGTAYHRLVLLDQAKISLNGGDLDATEAQLQLVVGQSSDLLADLARVRLAKVQHALERSQDALATLAGIRHDGYRAWALETKGDIHMSLHEIELAHQAYQAATEALQPGDERPLLDMKLENAAPFAGEFVQLEDSLEDALQDAEEVLQAAVDAATPETDVAEQINAATATAEEPAAEDATEAPVEEPSVEEPSVEEPSVEEARSEDASIEESATPSPAPSTEQQQEQQE